MTAGRWIRSVFQRLGFDLVRTSQTARHTLLGLRELDIRTIIDVGANTGQFARSVLGHFPDAKMLCFEPLLEPFTELEAWAHTFVNGRIRVFNTALGDRKGTVEISCNKEFSPSASILDSTPLSSTLFPKAVPQERRTVEVATLDGVLAAELPNLDRNILIKLDVQGYEDRVLKGGAEVLSYGSACILEVLLDPLYEGQPRFEDLVALLGGAGYSYAGNLDQFHAEDGHVVFLDAVFVRKPQVQTGGSQ